MRETRRGGQRRNLVPAPGREYEIWYTDGQQFMVVDAFKAPNSDNIELRSVKFKLSENEAEDG